MTPFGFHFFHVDDKELVSEWLESVEAVADFVITFAGLEVDGGNGEQ